MQPFFNRPPMRIIFFIVTLFFLQITSAKAGTDISKNVENFNKEISQAAGTEEPYRANYIRQRYAANFQGISITPLDDAELRMLFIASLNASSLSRDTNLVKEVRAIFNEMSSRRILSEENYQHMQGLYVRLRLLDDAIFFNKKYKNLAELEAIPDVRDSGLKPTDRAVFKISPNKNQIDKVPFQIGNDFLILVVAHPLCHFTQDAVAAISSDPTLRDFFSTHSTWIVPDDFKFNLPEIRQWNLIFPEYQLSIVNSVSDWSEIKYWDTPNFYIYDQGKVIHVIRGWPKDGHLQELRALIKQRTDMQQKGGT